MPFNLFYVILHFPKILISFNYTDLGYLHFLIETVQFLQRQCMVNIDLIILIMTLLIMASRFWILEISGITDLQEQNTLETSSFRKMLI